MTKVLATNITSPLGFSTGQNYQAIRAGRSALTPYTSWRGIPEPFAASMFTIEQREKLKMDGFTLFESIVIRSIEEALSYTSIPLDSPRTILILSTTKANVEELSSEPENDGEYLNPGDTAVKIARHIGIVTRPVVVCNACISGVTAQILADRLIRQGEYDHAIVCGADCISPFVVAGFLSFKSLSPEPCRPFDIERLGLNLGDAAATIIYGKEPEGDSGKGWKFVAGYLDNDAYHVSAPSPAGEGTLRAIECVMERWDAKRLAMINVHGTATMFNDQMESKAIQRASLSQIPISALKGYYGHTLGASGILETIISMCSIDEGYIPPVKGFDEIGVSGKITINNHEGKSDKESFLKIISGFGGCNGAILFSKGEEIVPPTVSNSRGNISHSVHITPEMVTIDGKEIPHSATGKELLAEVYKQHLADYPKFYKMDLLTKLAFVATELLIQSETDRQENSERGIILFNSSSSVVADRKHISTFCREGEFFPSPSVFLYTLPNILTGEIAIKNQYKGESTLYILNQRDEVLMDKIIGSSFGQRGTGSIITGWIDCLSNDNFEADIKIVTK